MTLNELISETYNDLGADAQEGGNANTPEWINEIEHLVTLLKKSQRLGLTFDRGNAYITRQYIDTQEILNNQIKEALAKLPMF